MSQFRLYIDGMTKPGPGLDPEARARIEAEERHREEYRRKLQAEANTPPRKKAGCGTWVLGALGVLLVAGIAGQMNPSSSGTTSTVSREVVDTSSAPATPEPAAAPELQGLGSGTYLVGSEVQPGRLRTRESSPGCYWARLAGASGELDDIQANGSGSGPLIVDISADDYAFQTQRCAPWTTDMTPMRADPTANFGDGMYLVDDEVAPGTWRASQAEGCYWARLDDFSGTIDGVIANNNGDGLVTISSEDTGFSSTRCGEWTKIE